MTNRDSHRLSAGRDRGFLVVVVLAVLGLFGILGALQVLVHASAGLSSRALEHRRQRTTIALRAGQALSETLATVAEAGGSPGGSLRGLLEEKLEDLDSGAAQLTVDKCPESLPSPALFPAQPDPLGAPSADLLATASPGLRALLGGRVAEYPLGSCRIACVAPMLGRSVGFSLDFTARWVAVPLTQRACVAYELPSEIGQRQTGAKALSATLGLAPSRDAAAVDTLQASDDALPYYFRRKAALAAAYQALFSQACVDRLAEAAAPTHVLDLDQAAADRPELDGVTVGTNVATLDLSRVGRSRWGASEAEKSLLIVSCSKPGFQVKLSDSVGSAAAVPLVLVLMGAGETPLSVELGPLTRPVLLLGFHLGLSSTAPTLWNGALFLDPRCTVSAITGPLHVMHCSAAAATGGVPAGVIVADLPLSSSLENLAPRSLHAAITRVAP